MDKMTIERLQVNTSAKLNADTKKALVRIIEDEFNAQSTVYNATAERKREEILDQYKKGVGFNKLKKQYDDAKNDVAKLQGKISEIEHKINLLGLSSDGERYRMSYINDHATDISKSVKKLDQLLKTVEDMSPNNIKNKIISRMWLAETNGEAVVILNQVLGNGIIPTLKSDNLLENKTVENQVK